IKDLHSARNEIETALREKPEWEAIQVTAALIDYFSALVSSSLPSRLVDWPEPVSPAIVKQNDASQQHLVRAEARFSSVRTSTQGEAEFVGTLDIWRLACLANTVEHRDKAQALCANLLNVDPANQRALFWALARGYEVDLAGSEAALNKSVESEAGVSLPDRIEQIVALVLIYTLSERTVDAINLLSSTKHFFIRANHINGWLFWHAQVLVAGGDAEKALTLLTPNVDLSTRCQIEATARRAIAARLGQWADYL